MTMTFQCGGGFAAVIAQAIPAFTRDECSFVDRRQSPLSVIEPILVLLNLKTERNYVHVIKLMKCCLRPAGSALVMYRRGGYFCTAICSDFGTMTALR